MEELKLKLITKTLDEKKAVNVKVYDVSSRSPFFHYFILATALNARHALSLCDEIEETLERSSIDIKRIDGRKSKNWLIVDCGDVLVHIFLEEERARINLEDLLENEGE